MNYYECIRYRYINERLSRECDSCEKFYRR